LAATNVANHPAGLVGVLPPRPLTPLGTFIASAASFAAFTPLWFFFLMMGGFAEALVAPVAISGLFWTPQPGPHQHPSRFALILGFGGDRLATLFPPDIPEPFAAFLGPVPTILGAIFTLFKLAETMVLFYLNWLVRGCWFADALWQKSDVLGSFLLAKSEGEKQNIQVPSMPLPEFKEFSRR
jgi:hypothetical protein